VSGNTVTVTCFNVPNGKRLAVQVTNVNNQGVNATANVGLLIGDVNGTRTVTAADILATKGRIGMAVDGTTFTYDVDLDGSIGDADVDAVKAKSGTEL
jgi:hypothetical protein